MEEITFFYVNSGSIFKKEIQLSQQNPQKYQQ